MLFRSKEKRQEIEKELFKTKKPIPQPTSEELRKESGEDPYYLLFTIKDEAGNIVRKITSSPQQGISRVTWDLKYESPETAPFSGNKFNPSASSPSGMPALPGKYSVSMDMVSGGAIKNLSGPVSFSAERVDNATLPVQSRTELDRSEERRVG